jgi:hypothetical protein
MQVGSVCGLPKTVQPPGNSCFNAVSCGVGICVQLNIAEVAMKKLKHEAELVKGALLAGMKYAEDRGAAVFEPSDSVNERLLYIYRLLVHDKLIQPLPEEQVSQQSVRHRLAMWYSKQLPKDHELLK